MKKKTALLVIVTIFIAVLPIFAEFNENEKPLWGMWEDIAYNLHGGEFDMDIYGPINYGIIDNLQIGTEFWIWILQVENVNAKINILPESEIFPAISVGGSYFRFSSWILDTNSSIGCYDFAAYITKQITPKFYINALYKYNGLSELSDNTFIEMVSGGADNSEVGLSIISEPSKIMRFSMETTADMMNSKVSFNAGMGCEFAVGDVTRIKIGIYSFGINEQNPIYFPFIDFHWRFSITEDTKSK